LLLGRAKYQTFMQFFSEHLKPDKKGASGLDVELCRYLLTGELKFVPKRLRFRCGSTSTFQRLAPYATLLHSQLSCMDNYAWNLLLYRADVSRLLMQVVTHEQGDLVAKHVYCLELVLTTDDAVWTFANVQGGRADTLSHDCEQLR
jgi:hypothetical protein